MPSREAMYGNANIAKKGKNAINTDKSPPWKTPSSVLYKVLTQPSRVGREEKNPLGCKKGGF
jgi:hypothetical protein